MHTGLCLQVETLWTVALEQMKHYPLLRMSLKDVERLKAPQHCLQTPRQSIISRIMQLTAYKIFFLNLSCCLNDLNKIVIGNLQIMLERALQEGQTRHEQHGSLRGGRDRALGRGDC